MMLDFAERKVVGIVTWEKQITMAENGKERELTETEKAIIDMMKNQALGTPIAVQPLRRGDLSEDDKKHAFWDTQVSLGSPTMLSRFQPTK